MFFLQVLGPSPQSFPRKISVWCFFLSMLFVKTALGCLGFLGVLQFSGCGSSSSNKELPPKQPVSVESSIPPSYAIVLSKSNTPVVDTIPDVASQPSSQKSDPSVSDGPNAQNSAPASVAERNNPDRTSIGTLKAPEADSSSRIPSEQSRDDRVMRKGLAFQNHSFWKVPMLFPFQKLSFCLSSIPRSSMINQLVQFFSLIAIRRRSFSSLWPRTRTALLGKS
jgi:hypothetical protein